MVVEMGFWVEVVTLVVPGFNDSDEELWQAAEFLASVSRDIPWHVTAFHKDYKMTDPDNTPPQTLLRAATIGKEAGLRYVYAGQPAGPRAESGEHVLPRLRRAGGGAAGLPDRSVSPGDGWSLSQVLDRRPGRLVVNGSGAGRLRQRRPVVTGGLVTAEAERAGSPLSATHLDYDL